MQFTKRLREPIRRGDVTCTVRIWRSPHVKAGGRYAMSPGFVVVKSIRRIELSDITPALARRSGFAGVVDLLKIAKHGAGENVYLIEFAYEEQWARSSRGELSSPRACPRPGRSRPAI